MTVPRLELDGTLLQAASLTLALIRFAGGAAPSNGFSTPAGGTRIGEEAYTFLPSPSRVPRTAVASFLAGLSSPALLSPTTARGIVSLMLLGELSDERVRSARQLFTSQRANLESVASRLGLTSESRVLLELEDETLIISFSVLLAWCERFVVQVGWNITPLVGDERASARMILIRSDGVSSPGRTCAAPLPEPAVTQLSARASVAMETALEEATRLRHEHIGTEHVLLAIVRAIPETLSALSISPEGVRGAVEQTVRPGRSSIGASVLPYTSRVKQLLKGAGAEAAESGAMEIEPEHLLLSCLRTEGTVANEVLTRLGADYNSALGIVRQELVQRQNGSAEGEASA